jgi:hypothetical protein
MNNQIRSGGMIKKKTKATSAIPKALRRTFFLSTKCFEYSTYVIAKAMAAAKGEKIRATKNTTFNTEAP